MASGSVVDLARRYLVLLRKHGFQVDRAILFGSQARGEANDDSDIDLLLPSADFDNLTWKQEGLLWSLTAQIDTRIEPIPCGERQWQQDRVSPLIAIAREEGIVIEIDTAAIRPAHQDFEIEPH